MLTVRRWRTRLDLTPNPPPGTNSPLDFVSALETQLVTLPLALQPGLSAQQHDPN